MSTQAPARTPSDGDSARRPAWGLVLRRVVQFCLDLLVMALLLLVPAGLVLLVSRGATTTVDALVVTIPLVVLSLLIGLLLSWVYWAWWPTRRGGRTLGMSLLRLRVVTAHGRPVDTAAMSLRWMVLLVDGMLFGLVGLIAMLSTTRTQRLGDLVTDTEVVLSPRPGTSDPHDA